MIIIHKDIELIREISEYDVILVGMGISNYMNKGFQYDVALNYPLVKKYAEENFPYCDKRRYGTILTANEYGKDFCLCYVNDGGFSKRMKGDVFIKYDCLEKCLNTVNETYKGKNVKIASNIIGWPKYEGGGDKEKILDIFEECAKDVTINVYDYVQKNFNDEIFYRIAELHDKAKKKEITTTEYSRLRSEVEWLKRNGIFVPMPDDFVYVPKKNYLKYVINLKHPFKKEKKDVSLQRKKTKKL